MEKSERFQKRLTVSEPFEDEVEAYLVRTGIHAVTRNGSEKTHAEFANLLRLRNDVGSKLLRFQSDGLGLDDIGVFDWEAKTTMDSRVSTIERDAYEIYKLRHEQGTRFKLFIRPYWPRRRCVYWNYIEEVRLISGEETVARFPEDRRFPVIDGWICPRAAHRYAGNGSGTPYREIDLKSMIQLADFYNDGPKLEVTQDATLNRQQLHLF